MVTTKLDKEQRNIIYNELRDAIGANKVKDDDVVLVAYASDSSFVPFSKPNWVVLPETRENIIEIFKLAKRHKIPVTSFGRGVNIAGYGVPSEGGTVMDLRLVDKIIEINIDSEYAVIEPGVTFDQFAVALAWKGFNITSTKTGLKPGSNSGQTRFLPSTLKSGLAI